MGSQVRTFLTTLAILFGVLVIFGMNILLPTILHAFQSSVLTATGQVDVTITDKSGDTFSTRVLDKVESLPGVQVASGSLQRTINIPANYYRRGSVGTLDLIGLEPKTAQQLRDYSVSKGRFVSAAMSALPSLRRDLPTPWVSPSVTTCLFLPSRVQSNSRLLACVLLNRCPAPSRSTSRSHKPKKS